MVSTSTAPLAVLQIIDYHEVYHMKFLICSGSMWLAIETVENLCFVCPDCNDVGNKTEQYKQVGVRENAIIYIYAEL